MNGSEQPSLRRDLVVVVVIAGLAFVLGMNLFLFFGGDFDIFSSREAPDFELPVMGTEETMSLSEYRGQVVLIDFWATWCPPCREQMPALKTLGEDPDFGEELVILSVNTDDYADGREARVDGFLRSVGLEDKPTLLDDGRVRALYGVRSIPTLVLIDEEGKVLYQQAGLHDEDRLRSVVQRRAGVGR